MRKLFLLFICIVILKALDVKIDAKHVIVSEGVLRAYKDVSLKYLDFELRADKLAYDLNSTTAYFFGDIRLEKEDSFKSNSKHLKINLNEAHTSFDDMFIRFNKSHVWVKTEKSIGKKEEYILHDAKVSSCDIKDPNWHIEFSKGTLDKKSNFLALQNPVFYVHDFPIFYLPYFGFSIDEKRSSGLLRPDISLKQDEGFTYFQPIFFDLNPNYDLEVTPQIRANRGQGIYSNFRFVDTLYSQGNIKAGFFNENSDYLQDNQLLNNNHYGIEVDYARDSVFLDTKEGYQDFLFLDLNYLNDIDYLNLKTVKSNESAFGSLIDSEVNYFVKNDDQYFGLSSNYYIDTQKSSNSDTLQLLPVLQYHLFEKPIFHDHLLYSVDLESTNYYRSSGINALQNELTVPVTADLPMFGDFLNVSLSNELYLSHTNFSNDINNDLNSSTQTFIRNIQKLSFDTNLIKKYQTFIHNFNLNLDFVIPSLKKENGCVTQAECEFVDHLESEKSVVLNFNQFFYDLGGQVFLTHRLSQEYLYQSTLGIFENEIIYTNNKNFSLTNNLVYSHERTNLDKSVTTMKLQSDLVGVEFTHSYQDDQDLNKSNYLLSKIDAQVSQKYNIFTQLEYDIDKSASTKWEIGVLMEQDCCSYKLKYYEEIEPRLLSNGSSSRRQNGINFVVNFVPLGKIKYNKVEYEDQ